MGRLTAPFRQVYAEIMYDLRREIQGAFIDPTGFDANVYVGLQASPKKHNILMMTAYKSVSKILLTVALRRLLDLFRDPAHVR